MRALGETLILLAAGLAILAAAFLMLVGGAVAGVVVWTTDCWRGADWDGRILALMLLAFGYAVFLH